MDNNIDTCKHRSQNQENYVSRNCCQQVTKTAYKCLLLEVFPLNVDICNACKKYEKKEESK